MSFSLSEEARHELLRLARETVTAAVLRRPAPGMPDTEEMRLAAGAFVTIKMKGRLRGCIGNFREDIPIAQMVRDMAHAAAFEDPRFPPVQESELAKLEFEISVLSPRFPITPEAVEVGVHGLYITRGRRQGVFLPQVPVEWGWDRETFLDELCLKAGLDEGDWRKPDARLEAFTALVIH